MLREPYRHVVDSYEHFVEHDLQAVVDALPPIEHQGHVLRLGRCTMSPGALHKEEDGEFRLVTADECYDRDLTLHAMVRAEVEDGPERLNVMLCYLPLMVGSRFLPRRAGGEAEFDTAGYFIVHGSKKVVVAREIQAPGRPVFAEREVSVGQTTISLKSGGAFVQFGPCKAVPLARLLVLLGATVPIAELAPRPGDDVRLELRLEYPTMEQALAAGPSLAEIAAHLLPEHQGNAQKLFWTVRWTRRLLAGEITDRDHLQAKRARSAGATLELVFADALHKLYWARVAAYLRQRERETVAYSAKRGRALARVAGAISGKLVHFFTTGCHAGMHGLVVSLEAEKTVLFGYARATGTHQFLSKNLRNNAPRALHPSHYGFICPVETPVGGPIGYEKRLATTAEISLRGNDRQWAAFLQQVTRPWTPFSPTRVVWNGRIVGEARPDTLDRLREQIRANPPCPCLFCRERPPPPCHAVVFVQGNNEIVLDTSAGRWVRPLWVLPRRPASGDLLALQRAGAVEFVDPQCPGIVLGVTHEELDPAFFLGLSASRIPFIHHNAGARNVAGSEMAHQAVGAKRIGRQLEPTFYFMDYVQRPICSTRLEAALALPPDTCNVTMIIFAHPYNQEDSLVLSRAAADRGLFRSTLCRTFTIACENDEEFVYLPEIGDKMAAQTGRLCCRKGSKGERETLYLEYEGGWVDSVALFVDGAARKCARVVVRVLRLPEVGDKFASRHGQKGVLGAIVAQEDLPYDRHGVTPDLILNPCAIPSRMTMGHEAEMLAGRMHCEAGREVVDPNAFAVFPDLKFKGSELYYNGATGESFRAHVFAGVCAYFRLRHMTAGKVYAVGSSCRLNARTRQPVQGRAKGGGLRVGEMESVALKAHGAASLLHERLTTSSDAVTTIYCMRCGRRAQFSCPCGSLEFKQVEESYSLQLITDELRAMGLSYSHQFQDGGVQLAGTHALGELGQLADARAQDGLDDAGHGVDGVAGPVH